MSNPAHVTVEITNWLERVDEITRLAAEFDEENDGISSSYHTVRVSETSDPQGRVLQKWNKIFQIACVLAILVDPLFLYIHVVKEDMKCLQMDINLQKIALSFRSVADLLYVIDITFQIFRLQAKAFRGYSKTLISGATIRWKREKSTKRILWGSIVVDGLAVLPIPQVVVFIFFSKMRGSGSFTTILLNFLIMLQYVPRVLRIYLSDNTISIQTRVGIWTKAVLNFLPFIIAGHVLGAMWYFFAIQRETACWESTCRITNECKLKTFDCEDSGFRNFTLLNELCPTNPPNATVFDFGIFLGAIQLSTQESTTFFKKLLQCFWWGLRNLSSLGSNLQSSSFEWENVFAVFIFLSGMILFLIYLSATLQTISVQLETIRSDEVKLKRKMQLLNPEIDLWLYKNDIPKDLKLISDNNEKDLKTVITENVQRKVQENKDVDVENILSILPLRHRRGIMRRLRLASLRKVPMLQNMDMIVLNAFCMHLKPMIYAEDSYIIPEEEPLEKMLFITHGTAWTYATNRLTSDGFLGTKSLERGDFYGEELLMWALNSTSVSDLPISTRIVKSQTKVEAFVIRAKDLKTVVAKFWWYFSRILDPLEEIQRVKWQNLAAASIIEKWRYYHSHPGKHNGRKLDVMRQFKSN